ncbi:uncharacterized protein A4U43_C04F750 [Asparagus officinalis]|uniref:CRIB domain-containing protein n=1 Tax=Asparagus officinalis TaxID=4686 RepID=A0A5P1EZ26_ASPOF|nr:uncharacterized protein A4U43_C04F750 [Asparagus officinalis]
MLGTIPPMKVKGGLRKGLKYISNIFEQEKEQEMVIGHPTDVKHVAHIGFDGPAVNNPTWRILSAVPPPSPAYVTKRDRRSRAAHDATQRQRPRTPPHASGWVPHTRKNESAGFSRAGSDSPLANRNPAAAGATANANPITLTGPNATPPPQTSLPYPNRRRKRGEAKDPIAGLAAHLADPRTLPHPIRGPLQWKM